MGMRFHIDIVSAESSMYSGQADLLLVPTMMGEIGILARHAPLISELKPGLVRIILDNKEKYVVFISSGFIEIQPHIVTILAEKVIRSEEFVAAAADAARYIEKEHVTKSDLAFTKRSINSELELQIALYRTLEEVKNSKSGQRSWPQDNEMQE